MLTKEEALDKKLLNHLIHSKFFAVKELKEIAGMGLYNYDYYAARHKFLEWTEDNIVRQLIESVLLAIKRRLNSTHTPKRGEKELRKWLEILEDPLAHDKESGNPFLKMVLLKYWK